MVQGEGAAVREALKQENLHSLGAKQGVKSNTSDLREVGAFQAG